MKRFSKRVSTSILCESLESRTLLSASLPTSAMSAVIGQQVSNASTTTTTTTTTVPITTGLTLNLTAGVPFTGVVAFYPSPVLDPPDTYAATISWGDGTATVAHLQYGTQNGLGGYEIIGSHTYVNAGTYAVLSTVIERPLVTPTPAAVSTGPVHVVARILSTAIVSPPVSTQGVTIVELANKSFTADVGSFVTPAPGTNLVAAINWGDGSSSLGTLVPSGVSGLDLIKFSVDGTHTYSSAGSYAITITIFKPSALATPTANSAIIVIATIDSKAIVIGPVAVPVASSIGSF